jgi:carboxypeptidase family protein
MNQKLAMFRVLVAVLVVVACGGLWMLLSDSSGGRGAAPRVETASAPAAPAQVPARELTPAAAAPRDERKPPAREELAARTLEHETFPTDGARWLEVTVVLPAGAPAEDRPALLGFAPRNGGAFEEDGAEEIGGGLGLDDSFAAELEDEHHWSRRPLAARVRLPFPASAKAGLLLVQSRYLHLEPLAVDLDATSALTLEPELGGWVTGRCTLPDGRSVAPDAVSIVFFGRSRDSGLAGFADSEARNVRVAADLSFELRALSSRKTFMVQAMAEGLVGHSELALTVEPGQHREFEFPFRAGATITGFVRAEGQPISEAHVSTDIQRNMGSMMSWGGDVSATSAEDGSFRLTGVPPGELELGATKDGWVAAKGQTLKVVDGQELDGIELELSAGLRIAGRVLWPDGTPAAGALVRALGSQDLWMEPLTETHSESDGQFLLGGLSAEPCEVFASHAPPAGAPAELEGASWMVRQSAVRPGSTGLVLTLAQPLPLRGTVVDDAGAPLTSFQVGANPEIGLMNSPEAVNVERQSPDGSFTLGVARAGVWSVNASTDDGERRSEPVSVPVPQGAEPLRLVVPRASGVSGVVVDPDGNPVAEASLNVSDDPSEAAFGFVGDGMTQSGDDGRFTLENVAPGSTLIASHADWASSESVALDLAPGETRTDLVLTLRIGARVTGELFDAEGKPEAGKNVNCAGGAMGAMAFGFGAERSTVTDGAGRFAFEHVTPGKLTVSAVPSQEELMEQLQTGDESAMLAIMSEMRSASVEVADGGEAHVVLGAKPKKPVRVHGVVTEAGAPLADKGVMAFVEGGALLAGMKLGRTDASGRYELLLDRPGDHVFSVTLGEGMEGAGMPFYVEVPEAESFEVNMALPLGRIAGTVLGPDGPAAGVPLRLVSSAGLIGFDDLSESNQASSGSDGAFEFHHLRAGEYAMHVGSDLGRFGGKPERLGQVVVDGLRVEADRAIEGLVVQLSTPGTLEGRVLDGAGKPAGGLSIFVRDASGRAISSSGCTSDSQGRFRYTGVAPGRVTASARGTALVGPESAEVEVRSGETSSVELVVAPGTFLLVSLLDGDAEVRARLRVLDEHGRRVDDLFSMQDMAVLFTEGFSSRERKVGPLAPGKYTLYATSLDGKDAKKSVTVESGREERSVKLRLRQ